MTNLQINKVIRLSLDSEKYADLKTSLGFTSNLTEIWFNVDDLLEYSLTFPYLLGDELFNELLELFNNNEIDFIAIYEDI